MYLLIVCLPASKVSAILYLSQVFLSQVPKDTAAILSLNGFEVEERGMVKVKGKGEVLTSYVTASRKKTGSSTASDKIVPVI
jgi:hypothetical protein